MDYYTRQCRSSSKCNFKSPAVRAEYKETIAFADKKLQVSQAGNRSAATEMGV